MKKITYAELRKAFYDFNIENGITSKGSDKKIYGVIVFTPESFSELYTEIERSYRVSSLNKAFIPGQFGYSIFANCLDGKDVGVRLEQYMSAEQGGKDGWVVDYCYLEEEDEIN